MSWGYVAVAVGSVVVNERSGSRASKQARRAEEALREGQESALDFQLERERVPFAVRDAALTGLAGEYGITFDEEGNPISDDRSAIERAQESPLYGELVRSGEEAVGRSASATGRLRGGSTPAALADVNSRSLLSAYNQQVQGLQGLSGTALNTNSIAQGFGNIGITNSQGILAQSAIEQQQFQNIGTAIGQGANALINRRQPPPPPPPQTQPAPDRFGVPLNQQDFRNLA